MVWCRVEWDEVEWDSRRAISDYMWCGIVQMLSLFPVRAMLLF